MEENPERIANILNDYFIEKIQAIRDDTTSTKEETIKRVTKQVKDKIRDKPPFELRPIKRDKLREVIRRTKGGTAGGYDYLDGKSLKLAAPLIEDSLIHLVNLSFLTNTFAENWKHLNIHPQHKKGETTDKKNQTPISHIQEVGKLVEREVADQILEYMLNNQLLNDEQHGAMKDLSPVSATACIQDLLLQGAEEKLLTIVLLIDLTAVYDTIYHEILDKKLEAYNFGEGERAWIRGYLRLGTQSVEVSGHRSLNRYLGDYGAPQGSILAGLLYLIYANDISDKEDKKKSILYVDDTTEMVKASNIPELNSRLQEEADKSVRWMDENLVRISESKTKVLVSSTRALRSFHQQLVEAMRKGVRIQETKSEKILGIVFSNDLSWRHHMYGEPETPKTERSEGLLKTLSKRVDIFYKVTQYANKKNLRMLAEGIFYSKLNFSLPLIAEVWQAEKYKDTSDTGRSTGKEEYRKLQVIQNKLERIIYAKTNEIDVKTIKRISTKELLVTNEVLSIHQLGAKAILNTIRKIIKSGKPNNCAAR